MRLVAVAMAWLLAVSCGAAGGSSAGPAVRTCEGICGRVVDGAGKPVTRFRVALFSADPSNRPLVMAYAPGYPPVPGPMITSRDVVSPDGWFDLDARGVSRVVVGINAAGYRLYQSEPFPPGAGDPTVITLATAHRTELRVRDERGVPVAGAKVFFDVPGRSLAEALRMVDQASPLARTDGSGKASLQETYSPTAAVLVIDDAHVPLRVEFARDADAVDAVLRDGVPLRGTARDASGVPLPHAVLEARCEGSPPLQSLAGNDGAFVFPRLPRARCEIIAARELMDDPAGAVLDPMRGSVSTDLRQPVGNVEVTVPPSGRVTGRLTGLERVGDGYAVVARRGEEAIALETGPDARFSARLAPGEWTFQGSFDGPETHLESAHASAVVADGGNASVELPFLNPTSIRIVIGGRPATAPELVLEPVDPMMRTKGRLRSSAPGVWKISGLERGMYRAHLSHWDWDLTAQVEVPSSRVIEIPAQTAELFVEDGAGRPVNADIRITQATPSVEGLTIAPAEGAKPALGVASEGRHIHWDTPAGAYELTIAASGYKNTTATLVVPGPAAHIVLQTIDRPYARPADLAPLEAVRAAVLPAVLADVDRWARERWRQRGEARRGRVVVADETVERPATVSMWVGRDTESKWARLKRLKTQPLFKAFEDDRSVHRLPRLAGVLVVPLADVPLKRPWQWSEATSEADLYDASAIAERWSKAAGVVLLSSPQLDAGATRALVAATIFAGDGGEPRLYLLVKESGSWRVRESWDIATEPGC